MRPWLKDVGVKKLFIKSGPPSEKGYVESFNGKLRDELLARASTHSRKQESSSSAGVAT